MTSCYVRSLCAITTIVYMMLLSYVFIDTTVICLYYVMLGRVAPELCHTSIICIAKYDKCISIPFTHYVVFAYVISGRVAPERARLSERDKWAQH